MTEDSAVVGYPRISPGVIESYRHGWQQLWKNFWELFLGVIITLAIVIPISLIASIMIFAFVENTWGQQVINWLISIVIFGPLGFGWTYMTLRGVRGEKIEISHLFEAFRHYGQSVLAYLLITLFSSVPYIIASVVLLYSLPLGVVLMIASVIVAIVVYCKLAFVPFILLDKKTGAFEAIRTSWNMTDRFAGTVFLIGLLGIPIAIAGFICFIIGIIPAAMWIYLAIASLYHAVDMRRGVRPSDSLYTPPDTSGPFRPV